MIRLLATLVSFIPGLFTGKTSACYFFIILDLRTAQNINAPG
jgi:hypothetical protein